MLFSSHKRVGNELPWSKVKWLMRYRVPAMTNGNLLTISNTWWLVNLLAISNWWRKIQGHARSRAVNFDLPHMSIPTIQVVWQHSNLQHKSVDKSFPAQKNGVKKFTRLSHIVINFHSAMKLQIKHKCIIYQCHSKI